MTAALWIEEEFANLKEAWAVALEHGNFRPVGNAAWCLVHFAEMRGRYLDINALFEEAIVEFASREPGERETLALGQVRGCLAFLAFRLGRYEVAHESGAAAVALLGERHKDVGIWGIWAGRQGWGLSNAYFGRLDDALEIINDNLTMCEAKLATGPSDERLIRILDVMAGSSHMALVVVAVRSGAFERALEHLDQGARVAYGQAALLDHRHEEARRRLTIAVAVGAAHSCFPMAIEALESLAGLDADEDRVLEAIKQLAFIKHSDFAPESTAESAAGALLRLRTRVPDEVFEDAYRQGKATTVEDVLSLATRRATTISDTVH